MEAEGVEETQPAAKKHCLAATDPVATEQLIFLITNNYPDGVKLDDIRSLIQERRADVNASDQYGRTPLYMACFCEQLDVVEFLVHNGATINKNLDDYPGNYTPLGSVCISGNLRIVKFLVAARVDVNAYFVSDARSDYHSLSLACFNKQTKVVDFLLGVNTLNLADSIRDLRRLIKSHQKHGDMSYAVEIVQRLTTLIAARLLVLLTHRRQRTTGVGVMADVPRDVVLYILSFLLKPE